MSKLFTASRMGAFLSSNSFLPNMNFDSAILGPWIEVESVWTLSPILCCSKKFKEIESSTPTKRSWKLWLDQVTWTMTASVSTAKHLSHLGNFTELRMQDQHHLPSIYVTIYENLYTNIFILKHLSLSAISLIHKPTHLTTQNLHIPRCCSRLMRSLFTTTSFRV